MNQETIDHYHTLFEQVSERTQDYAGRLGTASSIVFLLQLDIKTFLKCMDIYHKRDPNLEDARRGLEESLKQAAEFLEAEEERK